MREGILAAVLRLPWISQVRRNHALEHATMQVLSEQHSNVRLMGRSSISGFTIYGDVSGETVLNAAREGLRRLKAGETAMAIHPNCGSNYVVAGTVAGLSAFLALGGLSRNRSERFGDRLARLPLACATATLGIILSRPLGTALQAHVTTHADVGRLRVEGVSRSRQASPTVHFVRTANP
ncbi:MAG: DUF6391 domain-containing protein [Anaerolineae bacterium]|jgi:hypothetical protein